MENIPPRVNVLGVGISATAMDNVVAIIQDWIEKEQRHYISVCNVHMVMECRRDPLLRKIINKSGLTIPDGIPLAWLCCFNGHDDAARICGPDLMLALCEYSVARGGRHFFYGGAPGVAHDLSTQLKYRYPGLQVAGTYSPPFRLVGAAEESNVIEEINAASPDIIWVGLGTPKQDFWVAKHRPLLNASVLIPVGAAFDFHTGNIKRAPTWMQHYGLEWLFRLKQEPRRLAHRYLIYNTLFMFYTFMQLTGIRRYPIL